MKVLIVGHRGMLGRDLLEQRWPAGWAIVGQGRPTLDITRAGDIAKSLRAIRPDLVINAAAYTAVDKAETEAAMAFAVNRDGPALLAAACRQADIPLVHISTDYVFDGRATQPYREEDPPAPLGVYGRSKHAGEAAVRNSLGAHVIVRTAWLYGTHGANFVRTILRLARERDVLRIVADQHGCPTWSQELAQALVSMCSHMAQQRATFQWGTYHFCGAASTTWHGFAQAIVAEARRFESLRARVVEPISTADYPTAAPRPAYTVLDCDKFAATFAVRPRLWRDGLHDFLKGLYTCPPTPRATC